MKHAVWIAIGWLGVTFWTAVGARLAPWHIVPDAAIVTIVFLGLRRDPATVAGTALVLGYLVGRQALAPLGLHETALVAVGIGVYMLSGHLAASGPWFFSFVTGVALIGYHLLLYLMLLVGTGAAGFSSWATAVQLPGAIATGALALLSYPVMVRVERRLWPEQREGLAWR